MQISRHWRLNAQRYRLEGSRAHNGQVRFQPRIVIEQQPEIQTETGAQPVRTAAAAR